MGGARDRRFWSGRKSWNALVQPRLPTFSSAIPRWPEGCANRAPSLGLCLVYLAEPAQNEDRRTQISAAGRRAGGARTRVPDHRFAVGPRPAPPAAGRGAALPGMRLVSADASGGSGYPGYSTGAQIGVCTPTWVLRGRSDAGTATLLHGWEKRLRPLKAGRAIGFCLEIHDLMASKLAAGRLKDIELVGALLKLKLGKVAMLKRRIVRVGPGSERRRALSRLQVVVENLD